MNDSATHTTLISRFRGKGSILQHVVGWAAFIIYEQCYLYLVNRTFNTTFDFIYFYTFNILLFYTHTRILSKTSGAGRRALLLRVVLVTAELLLFVLLKSPAEYLSLPAPRSFTAALPALRIYAGSDLLRNIYFAGLATLKWSAGHISRLSARAEEDRYREIKLTRDRMEVENVLAKTRNAYLQQQLNPHLLFNTLSFIHHSVYKHSGEGAEVVLLLADIMRFSMEDTDSDGMISLQDELQQVENIVRINRLRYDFPLPVSISFNGVMPEHRVIPLVFLTLTENIFKHADFTLGPATLDISVGRPDKLSFTSRNYKNVALTTGIRKSIGLENLRLRLAYTYGDQYLMDVTETPDTYTLNLEIPL